MGADVSSQDLWWLELEGFDCLEQSCHFETLLGIINEARQALGQMDSHLLC